MKYQQFSLTLSDRKILGVFNLEADSGKAKKKLQDLINLLPKKKVKWGEVESNQVEKLVRNEAPTHLLAGGGDGTINYLATLILKIKKSERPIFCTLPLGYGNALAYNLGIESTEMAILLALHGKKTKDIDVLKINSAKREYGLFNISMGFDAQIVHYHQRKRYIGMRSYILSTLRSILDYQPSKLIIKADDKVEIESETVSLVIANAPYIGHNYQITPRASLDNGRLDCVLFPSKYAFLTNLRWKGFKHPLYFKRGKVFFKAQKIEVANARYLQIDGDPIDHEGKIIVECLPRELKCMWTEEDKDLS